MKQIIINLLEKELKGKIKKEEFEHLIEIPPSSEMGDFAFPCFALAKIEKKSPLLIAEQLAEKFRKDLTKKSEISNVDAKAGYVNFFVNKQDLTEEILERILKEKEKFGRGDEGKGKTIVIDMSSPNIAKPFGIGHLRSTIIGNSISEMSKFRGFKVIKINYLGDWGTQFGKLIVGYKRWGDDKELKKDPIKYMLNLYVKANAEEYEQEARDWFKKLEDGDKEALRLWKMFKEFSLKDFDEIYKNLGIKFDVISGESFYNNKMNKTIEELKEKKLLQDSDGAEIVDLNKYGLGICLIRKSDGATLYATRDITAAIDRHNQYKFSKMIYEVGQEQRLHFQQFFKVLELMGYKFAKDCIHVYHGLYLDQDGKKFATRKGKTVFMKEVLNETIDLAREEIKKRYNDLTNKDIEERAKKIAVSAIFYGDLKNNKVNDVVFDIDKFLEFDGNTGPYLLYSYARANSIIKKINKKSKEGKIKIVDLKEQEIKLIKLLGEFSQIVKKAYEDLAPNLIANYVFELAQAFNEFYHSCPVLGSEEEVLRLKIVEAFKIVMKSGLNLLGIEEIDEM
jgi:arginyl-tRNA synthetase